MPELALAQNRYRLIIGLDDGRIRQREPQRAQRQIRFLRQEQRLHVGWPHHGAVHIRPQTGDGAQQGGFTDTGRAANEQGRRRWQHQIQIGYQRDIGGRFHGQGLHGELLRTGFDGGAVEQFGRVHRIHEAGKAVDDRAVAGKIII